MSTCRKPSVETLHHPRIDNLGAGDGAAVRRARSVLPPSSTPALACLLAALCLHSAVLAAEPNYQEKSFSLVADKQPVKEVIKAFAASQNWSLTANGVADDPVSARFSMAPARFWDFITASHNLQWYFDGQVMHVTPASEMRTDMIPMTEEAFQRFQATLDRLGIADARFPVRYDKSAAVAVVSGPPRFIELAVSLHDKVSADGPRDEDMTVRVFRLKAALAADSTVRVGNQDVRLEGVASVVRRAMGIEASSGTATVFVGPGSRHAGAEASLVPGARNQSSARATDVIPAPQARSLFGSDSVGSSSDARPVQPVTVHPSRAGATAAYSPRIEADAGINAVIVRDKAARMASYAQLVEQLDQVRTLVEIEARMVEVERGDLEDLGIDWQFSNARGSVSANNGVGQKPGDARLPQLTTSLAHSAASLFLARVRALESQGRAKVVMTPRVLTIDNTEAVIENTETAYVKVAGNLEANLYSVSTGSMLRILPSVLPATPDKRRVRLVITLEDGVFSPASVDNVPVVQRSRIFTQSEIADGTTLVVGGMSDVRERESHEGVPVVSRIPGIGALFGSRSTTRSSRERLYMVTPRIVDTAALATPMGAPQLTPKAPEGTAAPATSPSATPAAEPDHRSALVASAQNSAAAPVAAIPRTVPPPPRSTIRTPDPWISGGL